MSRGEGLCSSGVFCGEWKSGHTPPAVATTLRETLAALQSVTTRQCQEHSSAIALAAPDYRLRFSRTQTSLDLHSTCTIVTLRVIIGCASVMLKLRLALLSTCTIVSLT